MNIEFLKLLEGNDKRSLKGVEAIINKINSEPSLIADLIELIQQSDDSIILSKASNTLYKIATFQIKIIDKYKPFVLEELHLSDEKEVLRNYCLLISVMDLSAEEGLSQFQICEDLFNKKDKFLKVFALEAQFHIAKQNQKLFLKIIEKLELFSVHGSASLRARCRKLLNDAQKFIEGNQS